MALAIDSLSRLAADNQTLLYFIVYAATIFFGNLAAFGGFWLVFRGALGPLGLPTMLIVLVAAELSGDMLWYSIGRGLRGTRLGNFLRNKFALQHEKIEGSLRDHGARWLFFSKFLYATAFPVIFTIGWAGVALRRFVKISFLAIIFWLPILAAIAYGLVSGLTPLEATDAFRRVEILFLTGLGLFILIDYFLMRFVKKILRLINGENGRISEDGGAA